MNLVVSFVILLCLACSELSPASHADHLWLRLAGIGLLAAIVPGLAFVQTAMISRRLRTDDAAGDAFERLCNRVTSCHSAVWLTASISMVYIFRWHDVVRQNWNLDRFILVDELLILAPIILSLIASWFVFSELPLAWEQRKRHVSSPSNADQTSLGNFRRWKFVSLRIRLYLLAIGVLVCLATAISDLTPTLAQLSPINISAVATLGIGTLALLLPLLASLPWNSNEPSLATQTAFRDETEPDRMRPRLRVWNTGNQIIYASAIGVLPWLRQVWISDRLQNLFPPSELQAIVRHELAHLRQRHVTIRTVLVFLPLALWSGLGWLVHGDVTLVTPIAKYCEISPFAASLCLSFLYGVYSLTVLRVASHAFEYQADLAAACQLSPEKIYSPCSERLNFTKAALQRLAVYMPHQVNRATLFHPSLADRIRHLDRWQSTECQHLADPSIRQSLRKSLFVAAAITCLLTSIILLLPA